MLHLKPTARSLLKLVPVLDLSRRTDCSPNKPLKSNNIKLAVAQQELPK